MRSCEDRSTTTDASTLLPVLAGPVLEAINPYQVRWATQKARALAVGEVNVAGVRLPPATRPHGDAILSYRLLRADLSTTLTTLLSLKAQEILAPSARMAKRVPHSVRGYRFGRGIRVPSHPLSESSGDTAANPLEAYFDAHSQGAGIWKWRHYFDIYHRHFARFRGREVHVVEIGIYSGGSLGMWAAYFGARTHVYGVDIQDACRAYESDSVRVFVGDQADPAFWADFRSHVPVVDIVIDDGGHRAHQQIATLEALLPHVRAGGVYVCEDTHGVDNGFQAYVSGLSRNLNAYEAGSPTAFQQTVHSIHHYPFLTVIEKPIAQRPQFVAPKHGTEWAPFTVR